MVLQFWFADNQHYKFGKKPRCPAASDLLSPGAVSSSAVGLGAASPATAPGQCGGGSLYRKGEESGSSPALPLRRLPTRLSDLGFHISEVPSSPSYSTDSDYASIRSHVCDKRQKPQTPRSGFHGLNVLWCSTWSTCYPLCQERNAADKPQTNSTISFWPTLSNFSTDIYVSQ